MELKTQLSLFAILILIVGYLPYFLDIFRGRTKPHAFTWLIAAITDSIGFAAQLTAGGGIGAVVTGAAALVSLLIFILAILKGERGITRSDWLFLVVGLTT